MACGSVLMPTPSSRMVSACSYSSQSMPRARSIKAVVRPPIPPPTIIAFIARYSTRSSSPLPACGERSDRSCDPGEGVPVSRQSLLGERPFTPTLSPQARGEGAEGGCHGPLLRGKRLGPLRLQLDPGFRLSLNLQLLEILPVAHAVAENLLLAGQILRRTEDVRPIPGRRLHGEGGIDQMRPGERDQIGAARGQDGVDLI